LKFITLLTDFGLQDGYAGILKGVIWGIIPDVQVCDLTHQIEPQDVMAGTLALGRAAPFFPPGTVHIAVVDPGVGTQRRPLAARLGTQYFVGPDNGLITTLLSSSELHGEPVKIIHLDQPRFWLPLVSNVFHGRDIFAPAGAHLAAGVPLEEMGTPISDPVRLDLPVPQQTARGWHGQVVHIDHFGNLATNIEQGHLGEKPLLEVRIGRQVVRGLACAYGDGKAGDLLALFDSSGRLSLCVVNGSAARYLQARSGDPVEIITS
jgi:S-adenosyl-L-methionine hydrolase (adenosine-forming)